jgi:hypothetical protein
MKVTQMPDRSPVPRLPFVRSPLISGALLVILFLSALRAMTHHGNSSTLAHTTTTLVDGVLLFSLAAGTGSMAIIQLAKQIFGVRSYYQERSVRQWLVGRGGAAGGPAYDDLVRALGYGKRAKGSQGTEGEFGRSEARALFNLPVDQLAAQVSLAADLALSEPGDYPNRLAVLTVGRDGATDKASTGTGDKADPHGGDPALGGEQASGGAGDQADPHRGDPASGGKQATNPPVHSEPPEVITGPPVPNEPSRIVTDADVRLSYQVRGGVDGLQLYVGQGWRRTVRLSAVLISGLLGAIWVWFVDISASLSIAYVLSSLILGGFIAWVLRDLVAIVERLRS